jgi:hypothetical protein
MIEKPFQARGLEGTIFIVTKCKPTSRFAGLLSGQALEHRSIPTLKSSEFNYKVERDWPCTLASLVTHSVWKQCERKIY